MTNLTYKGGVRLYIFLEGRRLLGIFIYIENILNKNKLIVIKQIFLSYIY